MEALKTARARTENELAETLANELLIGAQIQKTLLIGQPPVEAAGIDIAALTVPSQTIDGDFYTFFRYGDRCFDVAVGDVMGKGVFAALIGAACKSHLQRAISELVYRSQTRTPPDPWEIVQAVHRDITVQLASLERFITLNYSRFDLDSRTCTFVDAGHSKTALFRPQNNTLKLLDGANRPLGVMPDETYTQHTEPIHRGDVFLFYSDGLSEAMNHDGEFFGEDGIMQTLRDSAQMSADAILDNLIYTLDVFTRSEGSRDDLTCVIVKINEI